MAMYSLHLVWGICHTSYSQLTESCQYTMYCVGKSRVSIACAGKGHVNVTSSVYESHVSVTSSV